MKCTRSQAIKYKRQDKKSMRILRISKSIKNKNNFKSSKPHRTLIFFVLKIKKTGKKDNYGVMFNFYFFIFNFNDI